MKRYVNSDLAVEKSGIFNLEGVDSSEYCEEEKGNATVCRLNISNKALSEKYGRKEGRYVTVFFEDLSLMNKSSFSALAKVIAGELDRILSLVCKKEITDSSILVVGLGNSDLSVDAIGPFAVKELVVTRHLHPVCISRICKVSAIVPGVLSQTGVETAELVRAAAKNIEPDVIIIVDSLAAASCERLGKTLQISDSGITPGSGVGNVRTAINKENMDFPIISIGVPTVVSSSTLIVDALEKAGVTDVCDELIKVLRDGKSFFVCPRESDEIVKTAANLIATALNIALGTYT